MRPLRVGLLSNPCAGRGRARDTLTQVRTLLDVSGLDTVDVSGSNPRVAAQRARAVAPSLSALVAVGGDGTLALAAGIVRGTAVPLGIVPVGSGNDFARSVGLPLDDPERAAEIIVAALARGARTIDVIELVSERAPHERVVVLGNINAGFDALVNRRANSSRRGYTAAVLRELPAFRPRRYWVEVDGGERREIEASILSLCNSGMFGGGMEFNPLSRMDDGVMELVTVAPMPRLRLLMLFPSVFRGAHIASPHFRSEPCREVRISVDDDDMHFFSDGEERGLFPLRARLCPGALRVLIPSDSA